jgi:diguanylate cyclase (GGDEF)-like protein/PAS domain S-box-containing protein
MSDARSEGRFKLLAEHGSDVMALVAPDGSVEWVWYPPVAAADPTRIDAQGVDPWSLVHRDDVAPALRALELEAAGLPVSAIEIRVRRIDGVHRWASVSGHTISSGDDAGKVVIVLRDVDSEVQARQALADSERQFRLAMRGSPQGMAVIGVDGRFMSVNPALCEMLHRPEEWFDTQRLDDVLHPDDRVADREVRARLLAGETDDRILERRLLTADGAAPRWVLHSIGLLRDQVDSPLFFVSHFHDITTRKTVETHLEYVAHHDAVTGLANRSYLVDEIQRALSVSSRSGLPTGLVMLDLDHFKEVNDALGHATGDRLLRRAGERILGSVRTGDLVARQGGDEFVVVMRDLADPTEAVRVADRIIESFRAPLHLDQHEVYTTASAGVAIGRGDTDADTLLAEADTAMYVAKEDGRNRYSLFNDELRWAVTQRLRMESGLRNAITHNEFDVWYQPEFDLVDRSVSAVEALLRWAQPSGAMRAADRFIEVAEESGLIVEIGEMVIRRAFAQSATWNRRRPGRPLVVRVNLSSRQLTEPDLLSVIDDALATTGADPATLCFEITESAILRELPVVDTNLRGIHARGVALAVDDFGTGYASLAFLRSLPVSVLKLDRSFVVAVAEDDLDRRLVGGIIALAAGLGIDVSAEGVEREAQAETLRALGCRRAQGFLFSPAVAPAELDELLA